MTEKLYKIEDIIKDILEHDINARSSDDYLYFAVCQRVNSATLGMSFGMVLNHFNSLNLPRFESVCRIRRKVQTKFKHLRAVTTIENKRLEREIMFEEYATEVR